MPASTPAAAGDQPPPEGVSTIPEVLGANIRAYRQLKKLEQEDLADWMRSYAHPWRRATVSEVERARRNVTVMELVALVLILAASVEELLDPRGPGGRRGQLALGFPVVHNRRHGYLAVEPEDFSALICTHVADAEVERAPGRLDGMKYSGELPGFDDEPDGATS